MVFWVRIHLGGKGCLGAFDTRATISFVTQKKVHRDALKNTMPTAAIQQGDAHVCLQP